MGRIRSRTLPATITTAGATISVMMRVEIYVRPGSSATWVGGEFDGRLVVHVAAHATEGHASAAALSALANALGLSRSDVQLVSGAKNKRKLIDLEVGNPGEIARRILELKTLEADGHKS